MTKITKENLKAYADEIAQLHDEIKLKIHLGAKEAQDEWHEIEEKWKKFAKDVKDSEQKLENFAKDAELSQSGKDITSAYRKFKRPFRAVCWVGGGRASPVLGTDRTSVSGISASRGHAAALSAAMLR